MTAKSNGVGSSSQRTDIDPKRLKPAPYNPRKIGEAERAALMRGITEFGLVDPIIARSEDLMVLGGHQRLAVALELGLASVPVTLVAGLDDDRAAALNILLNNPKAQGAWDMKALSDVLSELDANGFDATLTGFDEKALEEILAWTPEREPKEEGEVDLSVPDKPESVPGQIYELGCHRLMCGDSTDAAAWKALMGGEMADMVFTDPPYGVSYVGKTKDALEIENDRLAPAELESFLRSSLSLAWAHSREGAVWYVAAPAFAGAFYAFATVAQQLKVWRHTVVWVKDSFVLGRADYHYRHEDILYGWKEGAAHYFVDDRKQDTVWEIPRPKRSAQHPTMKPVELVRRAIENSSKSGWIVVDPFAGSGSTLIAAEQTGRRAFLMEIDPKYCDVIRRRYAALVGDARVFA